MNGKVFLVGAGPGDPDLLTVKALKLIRSADVVLHDDLISSEILELIPATAHIRNVGKRCGRKSTPQLEINALLIAFASFGLQVVRLKGGDPSIFGRGGEEMDALGKASVEFEVVPGVTSALCIRRRGARLPYAPRQIIRSDPSLKSSCESRTSSGLAGLRCIGSDPCGLHARFSLWRNG